MEISEIIYASSLKGYSSLGVCWKMIHDVAGQLAEIHAKGNAYGHVDLGHIVVQGNSFCLVDSQAVNGCLPAQDIWSLAAAVFEMALGSPIFNGAGPKLQNEKTPIPSLPQEDATPLNELLNRCLCYQADSRPSAMEILEKSKTMIEKYQHKNRAARVYSTVKSKENQEKTDLQWPESMLSGLKVVVILVALVLCIGVCNLYAQVKLDSQTEAVTQKLLDAALLLRHSDEKSWNMAQDEFEKRLSQFTLMNELQDRTNDCFLVSSVVKTFGVNRMVTELKKGRRVQNTGRELLDGADARFNYSIFEKGVKKACTSTYTMSGRSGKQVFLIVPYSVKQKYACELTRQDGRIIKPAGVDSKGVTYFLVETQDGPEVGETLCLKISNQDPEENASFVIINHNYRDKK